MAVPPLHLIVSTLTANCMIQAALMEAVENEEADNMVAGWKYVKAAEQHSEMQAIAPARVRKRPRLEHGKP